MLTVKAVSIELIEENEGSLAWRRSKECRWRQNDVAAVLKLQCLWERERSIHRFWYCSDCDCHCVCDGGQREGEEAHRRLKWEVSDPTVVVSSNKRTHVPASHVKIALDLFCCCIFLVLLWKNGRKRSWWAFEPFGLGSGWAIWISFNLVLLCHFILFNHN